MATGSSLVATPVGSGSPAPHCERPSRLNSSQLFITYWYFFLPAYALAALMYTFLGRLILSIVFREPEDNYIYKGFVWFTEPVLRVVRFITPASVNPRVVLIFAALWMLVARILFQAVMFELDLAPRITQMMPPAEVPQEQGQ